MAIIDGARVKETSLSSGSGTIELGGAAAGHVSVSGSIGDGNQMLYWLLDANGLAWECGIGTVTAGSPDTFSRDEVLYSSNGGNHVALSAPTGSDAHQLFNAPVPGYSTGDQDFLGRKILNVSEPSVNAAIASGVCTLNFALGGVQVVNLTESITSFAFENFPANRVCALTVYFIQDATGGRAVDFSQFRTPGGNGVALSDAADAVDVVTVLTLDGTTFDAALAMGDLQ